MLLNQLSQALYEIRSTQKTSLLIYIYIYKKNCSCILIPQEYCLTNTLIFLLYLNLSFFITSDVRDDRFFLEINDQEGQPIQLPDHERKVSYNFGLCCLIYVPSSLHGVLIDNLESMNR